MASEIVGDASQSVSEGFGTPRRSKRCRKNSPEKIAGPAVGSHVTSWLHGAVRILQKDVASALQVVSDLALRVALLEKSGSNHRPDEDERSGCAGVDNSFLQLPTFVPSTADGSLQSMGAKLDGLLSDFAILKTEISALRSLMGVFDSDSATLKGGVRSSMLASSYSNKVEDKVLHSVDAGSEVEINNDVRSVLPFDCVPDDQGSCDNENERGSSECTTSESDRDNSSGSDVEPLDIEKFNAMATYYSASFEDDGDRVAALREIDLKFSGPQHIVKIMNLPEDYNECTMKCLLEHKDFSGASHFIICAGQRTAFAKMRSKRGAKNLVCALDGFEAWSAVKHTRMLAMFSNWQELDESLLR